MLIEKLYVHSFIYFTGLAKIQKKPQGKMCIFSISL